MPFNPAVAANLSEAFREFCSEELDLPSLRDFETLLQRTLGIANLRNVQLWTRRGAQQRNFLNNRLGEYEYDTRVWIVEKLLNQIEPNFPVKTRVIREPSSIDASNTFRKYINDNWIREYTTRIYFENGSFLIEYSADSSNNPDELDLDSDEFSDILE